VILYFFLYFFSLFFSFFSSLLLFNRRRRCSCCLRWAEVKFTFTFLNPIQFVIYNLGRKYLNFKSINTMEMEWRTRKNPKRSENSEGKKWFSFTRLLAKLKVNKRHSTFKRGDNLWVESSGMFNVYGRRRSSSNEGRFGHGTNINQLWSLLNDSLCGSLYVMGGLRFKRENK